jgi:predicted dehydrogenase
MTPSGISSARPLRIGILGAAGIAPAAIIRPAARRTDVVIAAVASRSADAAADYAALHGIEASYGSYAELFADPSIDLVYNALPPSGHAPMSIAALEAGKHVLCEKPFALNTHEAERMREVAHATGRRLIEAFHDRYHPLSLEIDAIVASGVIGNVVSLAADFSGSNPFDPLSIRHDPTVGGGALMDLGCYPVHWIRALTGEEPRVISATATLNPLGADLSIDASLLFPSGITAQLTTSMIEGTPVNSSLDIVGTRGTVHVDNMVFPSRGHSITTVVNGLATSLTVRGGDTYDHQLAAIVDGLNSGTSLSTEGDDSVHNMALIDAIYAAAGFDRSFR